MRCGAAEVLQIVVRHFVSERAQRGERETGLHGLEREGIHLDGVEEKFSALLVGKEVVDPSQQPVTAELPRMPVALEAERFDEMQAMLSSLSRQQVRPPYSVEDGRNLHEDVA